MATTGPIYTLASVRRTNADGHGVLVVHRSEVFDVTLYLAGEAPLRDVADDDDSRSSSSFASSSQSTTASTDETRSADDDDDDDERPDVDMDAGPHEGDGGEAAPVPPELLEQIAQASTDDPVLAGAMWAALCPGREARSLWKVGLVLDDLASAEPRTATVMDAIRHEEALSASRAHAAWLLAELGTRLDTVRSVRAGLEQEYARVRQWVVQLDAAAGGRPR